MLVYKILIVIKLHQKFVSKFSKFSLLEGIKVSGRLRRDLFEVFKMLKRFNRADLWRIK